MNGSPTLLRVLVEESTENATSTEGRSARETYEFIAFVLWYVAMFLCCIIPTCFAYRRKRRLEEHIYNRHQQRMVMENILRQHNIAQATAAASNNRNTESVNNNISERNVFILSSRNLYYGGTTNDVLGASITSSRILGSPYAESERKKRLEAAIEETTFCVRPEDLVRTVPETSGTDTGGDYAGKDSSHKNVDEDLEEGVLETTNEDDLSDGDESNVELRLPRGRDGIMRSVPSVCAICLVSYEPGDHVTFSQSIPSDDQETSCPHAFHKDCIVQWMAKKNEPRPECPCCRRPFCTVVPITTQDLLNPRRQDSALDATIAAAGTRTSPFSLVPLVTLPLSSGTGRVVLADGLTSGNDNEPQQQQRMMVILPNPDMVGFRDAQSR